MKQVLYLAVLTALMLSGCIEKERYTDFSGGKDARVVVSDNILIKSVFPRTPMIAQGGSLTLTAVVTDAAGKELESTTANPVTITWKSSNAGVVTVNEKGAIYGAALGSATITAQAQRGSMVSAPVSITVHVTQRNAIDVAEVFFNPMQAYIDLNGQRTFRLSAVDHWGAATSLSEGNIKLEASNENITITPDNINLTPTGSAVEVSIVGVQKGFTFVTPVYTLPNKEGTQTVKITGTPLVVQVKDSVETSLPQTPVDAGNYLSLAVNEVGGYKEVKVVHFDKSANELLYSDFYGTWRHTMSAAVTGAGQGAKMALSPFGVNANLPMIVTLQNKRAVLWYQANPYGTWDKTNISAVDIVDENNTYPDGERLMDIVAFKSATDPLLSAVHAAYYDAAASKVCLLSFSSPTKTVTGTHACMVTSAPVHSVSLAVNHTNGEPRLVYGTKERTVINENNTTTTIGSAVYYVSRQNGSLYRETVADSGKVTNQSGHAVLRLDRNNKPIVALKDGRHIRLFYREYNSADGVYSWQILPVDGVDPLPTEVASLDFALDSYNEPRLTFATVTDAGQKIRYARRPPFRNLGNRWVVESPGQMKAGDQGSSSAIAVDSTGRAHVVYALADQQWFNYWAEPNFFDYRNYPVAQYQGADLISSQGLIP